MHFNPTFIAPARIYLNTRFMKHGMDLVADYLASTGMKKTAFAKLVGISPQNFRQWEKRWSIPKEKQAIVARVLGITVDALIGRREAKQEARRAYVDPERLRHALAQFQKTVGASGLDTECLAIAIEKVDGLTARKRVSYEAKAVLYQVVYDELLRDKQLSDQIVADHIARLLRGSNDNEG